MMLRIFVSFIVGFLISLQVMAGGAPVCAKIYSEKTSSKAKQSSQEIPSVWGKDLSTLQSMLREYQPHFSKKSRLEKRILTNNDMIRETLNWMIEKLSDTSRDPKLNFYNKAMDRLLISKLHVMTTQKKINYYDFLRASYLFSKQIMPRNNFYLAHFKAYYRSHAHEKFLLLPTHIELTPEHINEMRAEGIMPLGLTDKPVDADRTTMYPDYFMRHDLLHANSLARTINESTKPFDQEDFKKSHYLFKQKISSLSKAQQKIYENIWFLLTHDLNSSGSNRELAAKAEEFRSRLYTIHADFSDLPQMTQAEFNRHIDKFIEILNRE